MTSKNGEAQQTSISTAPLLTGILLILCFPKADFGPLAFFALVPFLSGFPHARARGAIGAGLASGFVFFAGLLYWIAVFAHHMIGWLGVMAWLVAAGVQAFFVALFALAANLLWTRTSSVSRLFWLPSLWVLCEWLRSLGSLGMAWGDLAYTQWRFAPLLQAASLGGCWMISWLVVMVNTALTAPTRKTLGLAIALMGVALAFGSWQMRHPEPAPAYTAAAIQADINQDVLWANGRPADPAYFQGTVATFGQMIAQVSQKRHAALCVLAETALPGYLRYDWMLQQTTRSWATQNHTALIAGGNDIQPRTGGNRNALFLLTPDGRIAGEYAKHQLVPFGEFIPYRRELPFLSALHVAVFDDEPGAANQPALLAGPPIGYVGSAICYESTYPRFLRQQTLCGANVLCVITDDTWFGRTAAARQHMAMSALRAVENHRYLVRCAATGISAIFAPDGRILAQAPLFRRAVVAAPIASLSDLTLFTRWGDWFVGLCALVVLLIIALPRRIELERSSAASVGLHAP